MSPTALLDKLHRLGVTIEPRLRIEAPAGRLTPDLRRELAQHKAELLALLAADDPGRWERQALAMIDREPDPDRRADLRELFEHRAAAAEYDGGLTRQEAERLAYGELQAEARRLRPADLGVAPADRRGENEPADPGPAPEAGPPGPGQDAPEPGPMTDGRLFDDGQDPTTWAKR